MCVGEGADGGGQTDWKSWGREGRQSLAFPRVSCLDCSPCSFPIGVIPCGAPHLVSESDDPNLAAVLERLVDIKKGNTLGEGAKVLRREAFSSCETHAMKTSCERVSESGCSSLNI